MSTQKRKPRIALMGEFSAGKSTLSNLLLGARPLPEKVTATRLSPVWMSYGTDAPYRVDVDGREENIAIEDLGTIPVEETRVIRLFFEADILDVCDLIDFPGISDPNMSSDVWQRMLEEVDAVLWCTHATQAWRQSEAAVWETMPEAVRARSALLITRFDKLKTERDRFRVLKRLEKETDGLFDATFPISLTEALAAGDDYEAFEESGGIDFLQYFLQMIEDLGDLVANTTETIYMSSQVAAPAASAAETASMPAEAGQQRVQHKVRPVAEPTSLGDVEEPVIEAPQEAVVAAVQTEADDGRILPRRVQAKTGEGRSSRPRSRRVALDMSDAQVESEMFAEKPRANRTRDLRAILQESQPPAE